MISLITSRATPRALRTAAPSSASWLQQSRDLTSRAPLNELSEVDRADASTSSPPKSTVSTSTVSHDSTSTAVPSASPAKETVRKMTRAERDAEAFKRFEERYGGAEAVPLGELVDGQPQGMARSVKNNLFRLI